VIALAYRDFEPGSQNFEQEATEKDFIFSGFTGMMDPPKIGVKEAVAAAYDAKIRLIMITGDNAITARAIAEKIGMVKKGASLKILTGDDIKAMSDDRLKKASRAKAVIFSRVSPEDKYRIISILKEMGEVVAVTGDGVNDTLSLKRSDIGIAMGKVGSEVAKEAADIILLDDNFRSIVVAIREGRTIFNNLKKTILCNVTANFGELFCVLIGFAGVAFGLPAPITAVQILAIDLLAEYFPLMALTFDSADASLLKKPPRNLNDHVINRRSLFTLLSFGFCHGLFSFISFFAVYNQTGDLVKGQAAAYATLAVCQYINVLSERTEQSVFSRYTLSNPKLWIAFAISIAAVWSIINIPFLNVWFGFGSLSFSNWLYPIGGALILLLLHEIMKLGIRMKIIKPALA
jgi:Ca2+-transporting ATPase